jgi:uncharacterized protein
MDIISTISRELNIPSNKIQKALTLFNEGATVPFVARYRKEMTGNLDEVELINIKDKNTYWVEFIKRRQSILKSISEQGFLTPEIKTKIESSLSIQELEDLYFPFKPKKITKGQKAIKQGLKPLALLLKNEEFDFRIEAEVQSFVRGEVKTKKDAISGAINILSEWIAESDKVRSRIRDQFERHATIYAKVKKGKDELGANYRDYFDFSQRIDRLAAHRTLAILRAEKEGFLRISIEVDLDKAVENIERTLGRQYQDNTYKEKIFQEAYKRVLQPSFESEFKKTIKEEADSESISVFAENLKQLLLQSPLGGKRTLALDPGFRSGCKVAVLSETGKYLENRTIFPHPPQKKVKEAEQILRNLVEAHKIEAIAVGNGTAGIETEKLCRKVFGNSGIKIFSVNEAGASIYSASEIAREEFPTLDITVRGAISIGRRLMDPLAELVKIDAKSIGVGQYQHDVNQPLLKQKLNEVVEHCVNHVGVELNTATYPILVHVSGLGETLAKNIITYRNEIGGFSSRSELLKVPKMGKKTYEQSAGFLRIEDGSNPLDNTIIHPESYPLAKQIAKFHKTTVEALISKETLIEDSQIENLSDEFDQHTIEMVVNELQKPTRDPRKELKEAKRNDISSMSELIPGMKLSGVINNVTNFGAFVDIGLKESGLVHISELANEFVSNVQEYVSLNQRVNVTVKSVDLERKRIQLSMK